MGDFLKKGRGSLDGRIEPTYRPGVRACDLNAVLPERIGEVLRLALPRLNERVKGFAREDCLLTGVETRSSSPVRVLRDEEGRSLSHPLVYPCGEGCGYAGGIMSAAVDGIRIAESILSSYSGSRE